MKSRTSLLGYAFGASLLSFMSGCEQGHDHDAEHSHEPATKEAGTTNQPKPTNHETID